MDLQEPQKRRKATKKITNSTIETVIDKTSGEVLQKTETKSFRITKEPNYIKLYVDSINKLFDIPQNGLLFCLLKLLNYDGEIAITRTIKERLCNDLSITIKTFDNNLVQFKKKQIIYSIGQGTFKVNPELFGKGDWNDICNQREAWLKIDFTESGMKIKSSMAAENKEEIKIEQYTEDQIIEVKEDNRIINIQQELKVIGE